MLVECGLERVLIYQLDKFKCYYDKKELKLFFYDDIIEVTSINSVSVTSKTKFTIEEVSLFIPPVIDLSPYVITKDFIDKDNPYHWQQPCCTEMISYELHKKIAIGSNIDKKKKVINTYIGLPWATFIDKKAPLGEITSFIGKKISEYNKLVKSVGYTLNVHTVCQSIHWFRILDYFYQAGITDIHASHYSDILTKKQNPYNLRIHSWHLYAVNVEDVQRNKNIVINKPIEEKTLFASFKGAHMIHYLSDIRLLLNYAYKRDKIKTDIVIEINDEWHFNKEVFAHQVQGKVIENNSTNDIEVYNSLLTNSIFALCPEGAGINTIRFWEALSIGSIPVLQISDNHIPMLYRIHPQLHKCCVLMFRDKVIDTFKYLRALSREQLIEMQHLSRQVYLEIRDQTTFSNQYNTLFGLY